MLLTPFLGRAATNVNPVVRPLLRHFGGAQSSRFAAGVQEQCREQQHQSKSCSVLGGLLSYRYAHIYVSHESQVKYHSWLLTGVDRSRHSGKVDRREASGMIPIEFGTSHVA
jgi:hypothetical protein